MLTMVLQLFPSEVQHTALVQTMHAFNGAAAHVVRTAFDRRTASRVALERIVYRRVRQDFSLPAQLAVGAIGKASTAYKLFADMDQLPVFALEGAVMYDRRVMRVLDLARISLATTRGRIEVPYVVCGYQRPQLRANPEIAYLVFREGIFFLAITVVVPGPVTWVAREEIVAIDMGILAGGEHSADHRPHGEDGPAAGARTAL
jgi:putative transposase